jgi:plastocyanin
MMKLKTFSTLMIALYAASFAGAAQAAEVKGKIAFEGVAPAKTVIKADADPTCKTLHPDGIEADSIIVNANGTLKNVFVYVKEGLPVGKTYDAPKDAVKLDQHGCQYSPKVLGIQVNQPLEIINSDDTLHNVHALSKNSKEFNIGMPIKGMKLKKSFTKAEVMIKVKCEVHPWMGAWVGVLDHPFYAVSGDDGSFAIKDLPAGEYTIEAWHEKYGAQTQKITVSDATPEVTFSFKAA